jgi:CIC family chloride channel protein
VLHKFTVRNIDSLPVVEEDDPRRLVGMLDRRAVIDVYNSRLRDMKRRET